MRNFVLVQTIGTFILLLYMILLWGLPLIPALAVFDFFNNYADGQGQWLAYSITSFSAVLGFITYVPGLLIISGFTQRLLHVRVVGEKKVSSLASWNTIRWAICGHVHRATWPVLTHVVPSPIANAYYRLAGAKIGKNVQLNTIHLNDPGLVRIEDGVIIGGGAIINGHLVERGQLILSPITLKKGCLIGSRSTIQPGVAVGERAVIAANALVGKWKSIPPDEVWAGLPAKRIQKSSKRPENIDE